MKKLFPIFFLVSIIISTFPYCVKEKGTPDYNGFPEPVGKIMFTQCAVSGCHNDKSKEAAGGLSLESWNKMFEGGRNSVCVIPYRSDFSTFSYYINTFSDLGLTLLPTMPYAKDNLTREEVTLVQNWINNGAPNHEGFIKFSDNPLRKKIYVTNQGCDVVTVFDAETLLPMRYVNVGSSSGSIEAPHMVKVSPDGKYWYVISIAGQYLEKYSTADDQLVAKANIGLGNWNTFTISSDSKTAYCVDLSSNTGKIATVYLNDMSVFTQAGFNNPHGSSLNKTDDTLYVTQQLQSNKLYKIPINDFSSYSEINLYTIPPTSKTLDAHEVAFTPDGSKYFVSCQGTSEVRIFQTSNDQLLATIPAEGLPSEFSFSTTTNYVFVSCPEDLVHFPGKRGSILVIDYQTNQYVTHIYTGHQPHGIAVDDEKGIVAVANRNFLNGGPAPHHSSKCAGKNGYVTFIDLNSITFDLLKNNDGAVKRIEVSVDPYSVAVRH